MTSTSGRVDGLDKVVAYLQKREGIDKTLKIIRYTSRLVAAVAPQGSSSQTRFAALEKSVGVSRKAYRLGKFLQDVNNLRKSKATGGTALLEAVAYGGEGVYYFIEQVVWLIKAGAVSKDHEAWLARISAWAELLGYAANIWLSIIKLKEVMRQEAAVVLALAKQQKEDGHATEASCSPLQAKLQAVRLARVLRVGAIVQDLADASMAVNDIRGGRDPLLSHPVTLALAGLLSGSISAYKNWVS